MEIFDDALACMRKVSVVVSASKLFLWNNSVVALLTFPGGEFWKFQTLEATVTTA